MLENYCKTVIIEANTMVNMAKRSYAPAIEKYTASLAENAMLKKQLDATVPCGYETEIVKRLSVLTDRIAKSAAELENAVLKLSDAEDIDSEAYMIRDTILPEMAALRIAVDQAETITSKEFWPFPSYADMLFSVR